MFRALYTAATGMQAQQTNLDTIANNLSNSSTTGFQSRRMQFQDLIYQNIVMPGAAASQQTTVATGLQVGLGTRSAASEILQLQGDLSQTGNPLDLAIEGQGLFQVLLPTGQIAYTRSGEFHQDSRRQCGDCRRESIAARRGDTGGRDFGHDCVGRHRFGHAGRANRGAAGGQHATCTVSESGRIEQRWPESVSSRPPLRAIRSSARRASSAGLGQIEQGYLEQSNVSVVDEFINMIVAQRSYEASSRVVQAADEMFQLVNNLGK